jgi:hypothetical protein
VVTTDAALEPSRTHCHQVACHPRRGFVRADHRTAAHGRGNGGRGGQQRRLGAGQNIANRAFTDGQAEYLCQQTGEALEADRLGDVQMDDQRTQT